MLYALGLSYNGVADVLTAYTTNALESAHMQLRKIIKNRGHFPNDEAGMFLPPSCSTWLCAISAKIGQCPLESGSWR
jgi:hypothetical protein